MLGVLPCALAVLEMRQDVFDPRRIFDAGNPRHRPTTSVASLNVEVEHPPLALGLRLIDAWRSAGDSSVLTA